MKPKSEMTEDEPGTFVTNLGIGKKIEFGGQFGNQLFQIAAVLGQAERLGIEAHFAPWRCEYSGRDYGSLYPGLHISETINARSMFRQPDFGYRPIPRLPDCDIRGMFHSPRYFGDHGRLRALFRTPPSLEAAVAGALAGLGEVEFCAVHLRFYDHPQLDKQPLIRALPEHYTLRAIDKVPAALPVVLISDNPHRAALFAQRHLKSRRLLTKQPAADSLVDFHFMTHAAQMVISNSTFAWWAAFLNERAEKIFAPVQHKWLSFYASGLPEWQAPTEIYPDRFEQVAF